MTREFPEVNVRESINDLDVGASTSFPLERYDYIVSCRTRLQTTTQKRFSSEIDRDNGVVKIIRTE
jgi:hypothetical protein